MRPTPCLDPRGAIRSCVAAAVDLPRAAGAWDVGAYAGRRLAGRAWSGLGIRQRLRVLEACDTCEIDADKADSIDLQRLRVLEVRGALRGRRGRVGHTPAAVGVPLSRWRLPYRVLPLSGKGLTRSGAGTAPRDRRRYKRP